MTIEHKSSFIANPLIVIQPRPKRVLANGDTVETASTTSPRTWVRLDNNRTAPRKDNKIFGDNNMAQSFKPYTQALKINDGINDGKDPPPPINPPPVDPPPVDPPVEETETLVIVNQYYDDVLNKLVAEVQFAVSESYNIDTSLPVIDSALNGASFSEVTYASTVPNEDGSVFIHFVLGTGTGRPTGENQLYLMVPTTSGGEVSGSLLSDIGYPQFTATLESKQYNGLNKGTTWFMSFLPQPGMGALNPDSPNGPDDPTLWVIADLLYDEPLPGSIANEYFSMGITSVENSSGRIYVNLTNNVNAYYEPFDFRITGGGNEFTARIIQGESPWSDRTITGAEVYVEGYGDDLETYYDMIIPNTDSLEEDLEGNHTIYLRYSESEVRQVDNVLVAMSANKATFEVGIILDEFWQFSSDITVDIIGSSGSVYTIVVTPEIYGDEAQPVS